MPVIQVEQLRKRYGAITAVDGISFTVEKGVVFGMLGPNGAGKTTTVEIIEGLRDADSGAVEVLGFDVRQHKTAVKERIGVQPQKAALFPRLTVRETLGLFRSFYQQSASEDSLLDQLGLREKQEAQVRTLSGGQLQRLSVAIALVNNPDIVFLDEPTTGLDPQARRGLWDIVELMKQQGKTVFLTTHYMEEAERLCDRVAVVDHGRIIALGSPQALIREHFSERAIAFPAPEAIRAEELASLPSVTRVLRENGEMILYSSAPQATLAAVLEQSARRQFDLSDVHIRRATLEDVFLKLTGRHIRE
jgi:ABC-2 type transport system ATP-binding protein